MSRKIPQSEWSAIVARREQGEPVSAIARSYGCSPTAIHYILGRSRSAAAAAESTAAAAAEEETGTDAPDGFESAAAPQPVPLPAPDSLPGAAVPPQPIIETAPDRRPPVAERPPVADRGGQPAYPQPQPQPQHGQPFRDRRGEHQPRPPRQPDAPPYGGGNGQYSPRYGGGGQGGPGQGGSRPLSLNERPSFERQSAAGPVGGGERQGGERPERPQQGGGGFGGAGFQQPAAPQAGPKPAALTAQLDTDLQAHAEVAIETFRNAFGAALADDSTETRDALRRAASELMRAAARTTIVLERLDALAQRQSNRPAGGGGERRSDRPDPRSDRRAFS